MATLVERLREREAFCQREYESAEEEDRSDRLLWYDEMIQTGESADEIERLRALIDEQTCIRCGRHRPYCDCEQVSQALIDRLTRDNAQLRARLMTGTTEA